MESTQFVLEDSGELFTWLYPLHCLLLTGEDGDCYYFNDPLAGKNVAYPKEQVEAAYEGVGMQAVVLEGSVHVTRAPQKERGGGRCRKGQVLFLCTGKWEYLQRDRAF